MRKGYTSTLLSGPGNISRNNLSVQQDIAATFKRMLDDVERNSATRVCPQQSIALACMKLVL